MPRVTFIRDFDFKVKPNVVHAYKAGGTYLVKQACVDAARQAGAVEKENPRKVEDNAGR